ncbi:MAG: radical SAM protein [Myxococcales bacterium]|nr:radical SAM protein [Myxococcales bacterium]
MPPRARQFGADNPRAAPFVGWQRRFLGLRQLLAAKRGMRQARRNAGALAEFPVSLQLQTVTGCNASCAICPQRTIRNLFPSEAMEDALFRRLVEQCAGARELRGVGFVLQNEPLTDPTLSWKIRHFRDRVQTQAMTFIVTNGTLLTPARVEELLASGLDAMHISVNGLSREDFEQVNQGKPWETLQRNLEHFLAQDLSRVAVMLSFVRHAGQQGEIEEAVRRWRARGVSVYVHGINSRGGMVGDYERYAIPLEREPPLKRLGKDLAKKLLGCCPYPFIQMSVLASGKTLLCTHDWARREIIGDVARQSISEVWNGEHMREIRLKLLAGRSDELEACRRCDVFESATFA